MWPRILRSVPPPPKSSTNSATCKAGENRAETRRHCAQNCRFQLSAARKPANLKRLRPNLSRCSQLSARSRPSLGRCRSIVPMLAESTPGATRYNTCALPPPSRAPERNTTGPRRYTNLVRKEAKIKQCSRMLSTLHLQGSSQDDVTVQPVGVSIGKWVGPAIANVTRW